METLHEPIVITLPCDIGDIVYYIAKPINKIIECHVDAFCYERNMKYFIETHKEYNDDLSDYDEVCGSLSLRDFNERWFLTKEGAKLKLSSM